MLVLARKSKGGSRESGQGQKSEEELERRERCLKQCALGTKQAGVKIMAAMLQTLLCGKEWSWRTPTARTHTAHPEGLSQQYQCLLRSFP